MMYAQQTQIRHNNAHHAGYTLIECLLVIAITLIIIPVLYASIQTLYDTHAQTLARSFALTNASKVSERLARDIRSSVHAEDGSLPLVAIATSSITLYTDTDMDGYVERVRYFLDQETLRVGIIEPTSTSSYPTGTEVVDTIVTDVINLETNTPVFRYFTATSSEVTTSTQLLTVRRVDVTIHTQKQFRGRTGDAVLTTSISIRNLKDRY